MGLFCQTSPTLPPAIARNEAIPPCFRHCPSISVIAPVFIIARYEAISKTKPDGIASQKKFSPCTIYYLLLAMTLPKCVIATRKHHHAPTQQTIPHPRPPLRGTKQSQPLRRYQPLHSNCHPCLVIARHEAISNLSNKNAD